MKRFDLRRWYRRLRTAHAVSVLIWLRRGVLFAILATMLLWAVIAFTADHDIAAARRTQATLGYITDAQTAAQNASTSLHDVFGSGAVALTGTGDDFANYADEVDTDITEAAVGNAAGEAGAAQIQFVLGQLETCVLLADRDVGVPAATDATDCLTDRDQVIGTPGTPVPGTGGLTAALADLKQLEVQALAAQRASVWLSPLTFWWLQLAPAAVMLVLGIGSARILVRHFRRHVGPLLPAALLLTLAAAILVGAFGSLDSSTLAADPLASAPIVDVLVPAAFVAGMVLAHLAYRPRLAEYRFPNS